MASLAATFILALLGLILGFAYDIKLGAIFNIVAIYVFVGFGGWRVFLELLQKEFDIDILS